MVLPSAFGWTFFTFGIIFCFITFKFLGSFWTKKTHRFSLNMIVYGEWMFIKFGLPVTLKYSRILISLIVYKMKEGGKEGLSSNRMHQEGGLIYEKRGGWGGSRTLWFLNWGGGCKWMGSEKGINSGASSFQTEGGTMGWRGAGFDSGTSGSSARPLESMTVVTGFG